MQLAMENDASRTTFTLTAITFAVDGPEWDSLYENPENKIGPHRIHEGTSIEAQLVLWPKIIPHHWNKYSSFNQPAFLGFDPEKAMPERSLVSLKAGSYLSSVGDCARSLGVHGILIRGSTALTHFLIADSP